MQAVDLEAAEWTAFLDDLTHIAAERERNSHDFNRFVESLGKRAKPTMLIDGANVAFHAQNWRPGHFAFDQIRQVVAHLEAAGLGDEILVVSAPSSLVELPMVSSPPC